MRRDGLIFVHPSDELYGADRILLEILGALPEPCRASAECWLPIDLPHGDTPLCEELERRGVRVRHVDLPILRRAYRSPRALARLQRRARVLRKALVSSRPGVVYCTTSAAFVAAPLARASGTPHVIGHVQEIWTPSDRRILGVMANACHRLVAVSRVVVDHLPSRLQQRTIVVPNATPQPARVMPLDRRSGPLRFVVASRWNGTKGHRTLLSAWDRLDADAELVILGGPPSSGDVTDIVGLVAALRRPDTVTVVGEVADAAPYIENADVVLVPSDRPESFGLVAIEAFARGRPVVASAAGGLLDIVTHGEDGWLYPAGDADALARVLAGLTHHQVAAAAEKARAVYENRFTSAHYAAAWSGLLELFDGETRSGSGSVVAPTIDGSHVAMPLAESAEQEHDIDGHQRAVDPREGTLEPHQRK